MVTVRQLRGERTSGIERLSIQIFGPAVNKNFKKAHWGGEREALSRPSAAALDVADR